jgi:hypothetical protein
VYGHFAELDEVSMVGGFLVAIYSISSKIKALLHRIITALIGFNYWVTDGTLKSVVFLL